MRTLTCLAFSLILCTLLSAQPPTITDIELQSISDDLVQILRGKNFDDKLIVFNFTNNANQVSELGAFLAGIFRSELANAPAAFEVVDRDMEARKSNNGTSWGQKFLQDVAAQEYNERTGETNGDQLARTAFGTVTSWTNPSGRDPRLKGVDAIVEGTITTLGDQYYLNVSVKKKGDAVIATARGQITNTPTLSSLQGSILPEPTVSQNRGLTRPSGGIGNPASNNQPFTKLHLNFELERCINNGKYVECHLQIYSSGKDSNAQMCSSYVKIFNQNGGAEHNAINLSLADVNGTCWINKTLVRDTPIDAVFSFTPGEDVEVISNLQFSIWSEGIADFVVEFRDIFVE